jgi:putative transposase
VDRAEQLLRPPPATGALRTEAWLVNVLVEVARKNRNVFGIRKMWHTMTQARAPGGAHDQVARLMAIAGVEGVSRGQHTTTTTRRGSGADHSRAVDLIKRGGRRRPGRISGGSRTSPMWTNAGFCYASFVVDVYSRRHFGVAGIDVQDDQARDVGGRAGPVHAPSYRYPVP